MKTIEFIIASKNDNYCGDPMDRLRTALIHNIALLDSYKNWKITIIDWASEEKISDVLGIYDDRINFIYVNKSITDLIPYKFSEVHAMNCAIRLSKSAYIGRLDQDIMIGPKFVDWFFNNDIPENTFFHCKRYDLYEDVKSITGKKIKNCVLSTPSYEAADGIVLVPRKILKYITGYDEKLIYFNHMQRDLYFRLIQLINFIDLTPIIGYDFYHLYHPRYDKDRVYNPEVSIAELSSSPIVVNDENLWGLNKFQLKKYKVKKHSNEA